MSAASAAVFVLGMHRSGTSAVAGMLHAAGLASAGPAVRNWDNARGHHEALALVRLDETVLAASGGHWLAAPPEVRWGAAHERERERLLTTPIEGRPALLKDPRALLCRPFWRAAHSPFHALGVVRHPLAVARSLAAWRGLPPAHALELWCAHNRALLADHVEHGTPLLDFDRPGAELATALASACRSLGIGVEGVAVEAVALARGHEEQLVHHGPHAAPRTRELAAAEALHAELLARAGSSSEVAARPAFPNAEFERFQRCLAARELAAAERAARAALEACADAAAVAVPVIAALLRANAAAPAATFLHLAAARLEPDLAYLLEGKVRLAAGDAEGAVRALAAACARPAPFHQARRLLPHALRRVGRRVEAARALAELAPATLYPQHPLALLAEWAWSDHEPASALAHMRSAIESAPPHRRGRLRTRLAQWQRELGDPAAARAELERALEEDPTYPRARAELHRLGT